MKTFREVFIESKGYIWDGQKLCDKYDLCFMSYINEYYPSKGSSKPVTDKFGVTHHMPLAGTGGTRGQGSLVDYMDYMYHGEIQ